MSKTEAILWPSASVMDKDARIEDQEHGNKMIHTVRTSQLTSAYRYTKVGALCKSASLSKSAKSRDRVLDCLVYIL